jgi:hypothetical protein
MCCANIDRRLSNRIENTMFTRLRSVWTRRQLRPVVGLLPHVLKSRYGGSDFYTAGQVRRAILAMKLRGEVVPYAFAVGCARDDYYEAPEVGTKSYVALRAEIAKLFGIDQANFTTKTLRASQLAGAQYPEHGGILEDIYPNCFRGPGPHLGGAAPDGD